MPLSGVASYIPTLDAFAKHWEQVNKASSKDLVIRGATLNHLAALRQSLIMALNDVVSKENVRLVASGDRDIKAAEMRERFKQFKEVVSRKPLSKPYKEALPKLPARTAGDEAMIEAAESVIQIWAVVNRNNPAVPKFRPPLVLEGGCTLEHFGYELASYRQSCRAAESADRNALYSRDMRGQVMGQVAKLLKLYSAAAIRLLGEDHELVRTIPDAEPNPDKLPAAPELEGEWNPATEKVELRWTHPDPSSLKRFSLRYHPGPRYKMEEEESVESIPTDRTSMEVAYGLAAPGSSSTYKLYAVAPDSGEQGSNTIRIVRPS
ncbi:MAG: hypothetical protein M9921_04210 [Fimbriimonadaceae bacterium]|nr:hypothetical protein [Chthonomonadaceae bacterium]MCO5296039.1 hypothetical protein [Fimbriimonadaceae bacterium]